jgi:hypothetical protein
MMQLSSVVRVPHPLRLSKGTDLDSNSTEPFRSRALLSPKHQEKIKHEP